MDTVEALKRTPKGQISYSKPWEERSPSEKQAFLEDISSPPPISVAVTLHRTHPPTVNPSPPSPPSPPLTPPSTPPLPPSQSSPPVSNVSDIVSPIKVIQDELNDYHESNEDSIMREVEDRMATWRKSFKNVVERQFGASVPIGRLWEIRDKSKRITDQEEEEEERELKKIIEDKLKSNEQSYLLHFQSVQEEIKRSEERRQQQMKELQEARKQRICALKAQFERIEQHAVQMAQNMSLAFQSCQYPGLLASEAVESAIKDFNTLIGRLVNESLAEKHSESPNEETLKTLGTFLPLCDKLLTHVRHQVDIANVRGVKEEQRRAEEDRQRQAELEKQKKEREERERQMQQPVKVDLTTKGQSKGTTSQGGGGGENSSLGVTVSPSGLQSYTAYQEKLEQALKSTETISKSSDTKLKKFRFDLQKAVNTPVCGISSQSGRHLFDKIKRLRQLLSGGIVNVVGGTVSIGQHPEAKMYCLNFLAKKLVKQGEEQVSSRPVTAFPIAGVIVYLSSDYPELMDLFVAHCLASCPLLVPMYFEKNPSTDEADYHKLQGYKVSEEGIVEKEDLFLKRIGGIIRLLAAVMQTNISNIRKPHPYGLEHCWVWLARVLNMGPRPNITATAILNMLEVCGNAMLKRYGKQFQKLVQLLCKDYMPKMASVTPADQQGPYSRLKMFLDECVSKNRIPEPEGILTNEFWTSYTRTNIIGE